MLIDARLYDNVTCMARRYRLRVTAARATGHRTHGDGTAVDLIPAEGVSQEACDASAGALAQDLGWTPSCGRSGIRPACAVVPAIRFVGYPGQRLAAYLRRILPGPRAHVLGFAVLRHRRASPPCNVVMAFRTPQI